MNEELYRLLNYHCIVNTVEEDGRITYFQPGTNSTFPANIRGVDLRVGDLFDSGPSFYLDQHRYTGGSRVPPLIIPINDLCEYRLTLVNSEMVGYINKWVYRLYLRGI